MALGPQNPAKPGDDKKKKKDDAEQDVFMREVDDAMREDQLYTFWERYGRWLLGAIFLGLVAFAGWLYYDDRQDNAAGLTGEEYMNALDALRRDNLDGANTALKPLADDEGSGYRAAAQMLQAGIALEKDDTKAAAAQYGKVAADEKVPQPYRDAALLRQTLVEYDQLKPQAIVDRLKPLAVPGSPWFGSAGEMVAIAYMNMDKPDLAGPLFAQIAKDETVPRSIRDRAQQMTGMFGIDTSEDVLKEGDAPSGIVPVAQPKSEGKAE